MAPVTPLTGTDWGDLLRHLRETRGWSQEQCALGAQRNRAQISRWEAGDLPDGFIDVCRLIEHLGFEFAIAPHEVIVRQAHTKP